MKPEVISSTLKKMVNHKHLRKLMAKRIDDYVYKIVVEDDSEDLIEVRIKKIPVPLSDATRLFF